MDFSAILLNMSSQAATQNGQQGGGSMTLMLVLFMAFMIGYMFLISRKDKKQRNAEQEMRDNLSIGDEVLTIGGIIGRVVTVKEDSVVIETGADRNKIRFTKTAIAKNITKEAKDKEAQNAKIAAAKKAKEEKKAAKAKK
ncbi:MAG: preprotein translocase subunit YajC [Oscillospiraceae bacterium]|nr:preprotein translocase subunit YajC [Oscillospiraceae bacterium]